MAVALGACGEAPEEVAATPMGLCLVAAETCGDWGYVDPADCAANLVDDGGCTQVEEAYLVCALPCEEAEDCASFRTCEDGCLATVCGG